MMKQADMPSGLEGGESWNKAMNPDPALDNVGDKIRQQSLTTPWRFDSFSYSALIG